jgi:hypothetical protein
VVPPASKDRHPGCNTHTQVSEPVPPASLRAPTRPPAGATRLRCRSHPPKAAAQLALAPKVRRHSAQSQRNNGGVRADHGRARRREHAHGRGATIVGTKVRFWPSAARRRAGLARAAAQGRVYRHPAPTVDLTVSRSDFWAMHAVSGESESEVQLPRFDSPCCCGRGRGSILQCHFSLFSLVLYPKYPGTAISVRASPTGLAAAGPRAGGEYASIANNNWHRIRSC